MSDKSEANEDRKFVAQTGTFSMALVSERHRCYEEDSVLPAHKKILLPLLQSASECWVYGIKEQGPVYKAAQGILESGKGKHRVCLDGDPIKRRELFWNAQGGKRGTIVILIPRVKFDAERIFRSCYDFWVFYNFLSGHTPAAIRFVRETVATSDVVAVCLPRNNGIEWMDIYINPKRVLKLYDVAAKVCV